jgi:hypothetical protein
LADIGSAINAAINAAAVPTTGVLAAGADEVSAATAALFGLHAQAYQPVSAHAAALHDEFVCALAAGGASYAAAAAANASPLQELHDLGERTHPGAIRPPAHRRWHEWGTGPRRRQGREVVRQARCARGGRTDNTVKCTLRPRWDSFSGHRKLPAIRTLSPSQAAGQLNVVFDRAQQQALACAEPATPQLCRAVPSRLNCRV